MIRTLWTALNGIVATLICSSVVVIAALLRVRRGGVYDWGCRFWSKWMLWASNVDVRVEGGENIHADRPQIIVSNHQSWYDVWVLGTKVRKRYYFVAKKELGTIPLFGRAWKSAGHISVDRSDSASAIRSLQQAGVQLREENGAVIIFPEGTRSTDGRLGRFKKGAFRLAHITGVEIVPVAVIGSGEVLPKDGWRVRPGTITVRIGEPIPVQEDPEASPTPLLEQVRGRIRDLQEARPLVART